MRQIKTTVYLYDELPTEQAKAKAREWYAERNVDDASQWWETVYVDAEHIGKILGFDIHRIQFSGFWSQGDGASFVGSYTYEPEWRKKLTEYAPLENEVCEIGDSLQATRDSLGRETAARIVQDGRYVHDGTMIAIAETEVERSGILYCARRFAKWIYRQLEKQHEYLTSDEVVAEALRQEGCEFTADGSPV
jgi:hypothetical protein